MKVFESSEGNVWKYVFDTEFPDAIAEAVLYRYGSFDYRTVICISVQSGCPVGCKFCGTGKRFIRSLTAHEIIQQVNLVLGDKNIHDVDTRCKKFQIMFMSMGEPFLNYKNINFAIDGLSLRYPKADLLVSTIGPSTLENFGRSFIQQSCRIKKIGLQFSVHASTDTKRNTIIPMLQKLNLRQLRDYGIQWWHETGRKPYINYCITPDFSYDDVDKLTSLFPPNVFCFTFSVICSADETMKDAGYRDLKYIKTVASVFRSQGYDVRVFDPAGQDDIGGGCGQLWYVQKYLKEHDYEKE